MVHNRFIKETIIDASKVRTYIYACTYTIVYIQNSMHKHNGSFNSCICSFDMIIAYECTPLVDERNDEGFQTSLNLNRVNIEDYLR